MKNRLIFLFYFLTIYFSVSAQDDLMKDLEASSEDKPQVVTGTFKSTRVINSHSVEVLAKKQLDFRISHRFGRLNSGAYNFFGLDQATIRLALEYGITDRINAGFGRSSFGKTFDGYAKIKILQQTKGKGAMPVSLVWFSSITLQSLKTPDAYVRSHFSGRLAYTHQLIIGSKISDLISIQVSPTLVHFNYAQDSTLQNDVFAAAFGGRCKVSKRVSINVDYIQRFTMASNYQNSIAVGVDIETGGHVFQLHITNSQGMVEPMFIANTSGRVTKGDLFYGFNISRQFNLGSKRKNI